MSEELMRIKYGVPEVVIPPEEIQKVIDIGDSAIFWARQDTLGFLIDDKLIPEIRGYIIGIKSYLIKWEGGVPDKIPLVKEEEAPEGYEPRCDVKILCKNYTVGLSLPTSSFKYRFSPYIKALRLAGLQPSDVITVARTKEVMNRKQQKFTLVIFETAEPEKLTMRGRTGKEKFEEDVPDFEYMPPEEPPSYAR